MITLKTNYLQILQFPVQFLLNSLTLQLHKTKSRLHKPKPTLQTNLLLSGSNQALAPRALRVCLHGSKLSIATKHVDFQQLASPLNRRH